MDSSVRFYNTNSNLCSPIEDEQQGRSTAQLPVDDNGYTEQKQTEAGEANKAETPATVTQAQPEKVDVADFEALFQRYQVPITNFIYHLIGNREQAYDLAQDVFVKAYKALLGGTVVQSGALSAWLYRIAANTTTDSLRRRRLIAWLPLSLFNEDRGIGSGVISDAGNASSDGFSGNSDDGNEPRTSTTISSMYERGGYDGGRFESRVADREIVQRVFQQLPPKYATCLWLYENDGFSCAEIAEILNISSSAVKMRLMRARERFIGLYRNEVDGD